MYLLISFGQLYYVDGLSQRNLNESFSAKQTLILKVYHD